MSLFSAVVLVGYGSIGQAITPFLFNNLRLTPVQISIFAADADGVAAASAYGLRITQQALTIDNYQELLASKLKPGDLLLNVSVEVSSLALISWCQQHEVHYLDTCVEPWSGGYYSSNTYETTNYYLRQAALNLHQENGTTAVIAHGANPGLVSHFVKEGLLQLANYKNVAFSGCWANLAHKLGVQVVQIAERDTQSSAHQLIVGEFANTWSIDALIAEAWQYAEMGWGTHENDLPDGVRFHPKSHQSAAYLEAQGSLTKVKSWLPALGEQEAFLISHHESLSIADLLTLKDAADNILYRPTVYFAYHPADLACQSLASWAENKHQQPLQKHLLRDDLISGFDQVGVLFVFSGGAYWYGSTLTLEEARKLAPMNNATSLQVVAGILAAIQWMKKNPTAGVVEAEDIAEFDEILHFAKPYLGDVSGVMSSWQPAGDGELQLSDFMLNNNQ